MGQIVVNVGSFDLTSHNGNTAYSSVRYFDIPANAGITACVATFAQHVNTGSFQGKSFSLNGVQAHPNTPWPTSGIALNTALLATGQNTFRAAVKSQAGLSARWAIGDIYLTITYNDVGGGGQPIRNIGTLSVAPSTLTAGSSININIGACDGDLVRDVVIAKADGSTPLMVIATGWGSAANTWIIEIPVSWCSSLAPDDPDFTVVVYSEAFVIGGGYGGKIGCPVTVSVPSTAVPTIGAFTAALNSNGVDASITKYVQNYSKVNLEMSSVAGALGSSISAYEITGGGFSAAASSAAMGPFGQAGDITFTAKATDSRGRTATRTVTINVLPYTPVSGVNLTAYRSDALKAADDEGAYATLRGRRVFSSLDGQNAGTIKGRVYEKDTTPGGWTAMSDDTLLLLGGSMSIEKGYTAEIYINDKITAVVYVFQIPTAIVGIHITPGATGGGFGMYGQADGWYFSKKLIAPGLAPNPNIFDNWDFRNPVNQRGVEAVSTEGAYTIDRWIIGNSGTFGLNAGYVFITANAWFLQKIEGEFLLGKTVTFSVLLSDGTYRHATLVVPTVINGRADYDGQDIGLHIFFNNAGLYVVIEPKSETTSRIAAAKLEMGTVSTLHLDPPVDHAGELPKCKRFYRLWSTDAARTASLLEVGLMRTAAPTTGTIVIGSATYYYASSDL